jgi:hypothetical protein
MEPALMTEIFYVFSHLFPAPQSNRTLLMRQPMLALPTSTLLALAHPHVSIFFPELATSADGNPFIVYMLLYPLESTLGPLSH